MIINIIVVRGFAGPHQCGRNKPNTIVVPNNKIFQNYQY